MNGSISLIKLVAQLERARDRSGFDQSRALPALAPGFIIEHRRAHRLHERSAGAHGTKPEIDAKNETVFSNLAHGVNNLFPDVAEKFSRIGFAFAPAGAFAFVALVEKDDVDIGAEIELAAAKLSHTENDEAIGLFGFRLD